jgi:hypothetical protein
MGRKRHTIPNFEDISPNPVMFLTEHTCSLRNGINLNIKKDEK